MKKRASARARSRRSGTPGKKRSRRRLHKSFPRMLHVHVRTPRIRVPAPRVTVSPPVPPVQMEAPHVQVQAPDPIVIPPPVVHVEVDSDDHPDEACLKGLRRELQKCLKNKQPVELLLPGMGDESRRCRVGVLARVDEGIVELNSLPDDVSGGVRVLIPLNRIVGLVAELPAPTD
jgi:hypothetical protein